ncbi:aspartate kinase [Candidatus Gottesmanbacteria bacterium RIFCSPLOWO2_01_FULL_46_9]|uniref:UMP kinase n=1 Tax=Candidatus Gottesmanbacteria bacterium RIFCSPLOWO2_01_FULL_46_9 TaxID=1798394 RepID=A0A1F6B322_9BACT|nr:MAG: aspartate kinase [Candidatus Gottesmanbacteria bacterium RIFCSPLOWO2_01_FULL_46_9]
MTIKGAVFVLSLGGSLVVPNGGIDTKFLINFNAFIRDQISSKKRRFFITVGGGSEARHYINAAIDIRGHQLTTNDNDWLGIHATRLNAQLIRTIFQDIADPRVIKHYEVILKIDKPLAIAAGWKPGWSTDYCAITLCQDYNISQVINLTNIDHVYSQDPRTNPDATPLSDITWEKYSGMVGDKWTPGLNAPFDPIASKLAQDAGVTVKLLNGKDLDNLAEALDDHAFVGTTIHN